MFLDPNFNSLIMTRVLRQGPEYLNYRLDNLFALEAIYVPLVEENGNFSFKSNGLRCFRFFFQLFVVYWRYHSKHCLNSRSGGYKNLSLQKWDFDVYVPYVENN